MIKYEPLSTEKHKDFSINQNFPMNFCEKDSLCPILLDEVERVASQAPIVFVKNQQDTFELSMLLSFKPEKNNFLNKALQWTGNYMPAIYRCYPFALLTEKPSEKKILGFDASSEIITNNPTGESKKLFEKPGVNSQHLNNILQFLNAIENKKQETQIAIKQIADYDLIEEWSLQLTNEGKKENIKGLWRISKERFENIDKKAFLTLRELGCIHMIYGHFISLFAINNLIVSNKASNNAEKTLVDLTREKQEKRSKQDVDNLVQNLLLDD